MPDISGPTTPDAHSRQDYGLGGPISLAGDTR